MHDLHDTNQGEPAKSDGIAESTALVRTALDLLAQEITERVLSRINLQPAPADSHPLVDVKAASEKLGVSVSTIYKLAARQVLPSVKISERLLFEPEALDAYIAGQRRDRSGTLQAARNVRRRK